MSILAWVVLGTIAGYLAGAIVKGDEAVNCKVVGQDKGRPKLGPDGDAVLRAHVEAHPYATLPEHAARLEVATGVHLSPSHLSRVLARLEVPLKKRP